jgi:hypothetical protein
MGRFVRRSHRVCQTALPTGLWNLTIVLLLVLVGEARGQREPIGHWTLDTIAPSGITADCTPAARHATCVAGAQASCVPGKLASAVRFPAAGLISLDRYAAELGKLSSFTVSMWIQYDGGESRQLFTFSDGTFDHRIQMEVHAGQLHFGWQNGGGFVGFGTPPLDWKPGTWYHVVFVNDNQAGKSILRSNDLVWKMDPNTLSPAQLTSPVSQIAIGSLNNQYLFNGCVDDVRLFDSALSLSEQLALEEEVTGPPADPNVAAARTRLIQQQRRRHMVEQLRQHLLTDEASRWAKGEFQRQADWLFQLEDDDLWSRAVKEIGWTRDMIARQQRRRGVPTLSEELRQLEALEQQAAACEASLELAPHQALYFDVRALKRRVMLQAPELDFSRILCVDASYPHRSPDTHGTFQQDEWVHESRFRSEMCASHGAKLVVLDDVAGTATPRQLAPPGDFGQPVAMFSFDLSFDGNRAVFCMKPEREKAYHLYEIGLDGQGFRQITNGGYSDIDPIYLPGGRYLFLSTRAEVYAQCGMWARSHILTRCDADGANVYILSPATEPEYSPSLLGDGRILFTRWEYVDKFANRIQGLWSMRTDGTAPYARWGNQSVYPDHLGEAREVPGSGKILFSGFGHHDVWSGCIGIVDPRAGLNFPHGLWKVTQELPWPEVGDGPIATPGATTEYHTSGKYAAYKTPYPLGDELFLVSARTGNLGTSFMHSAHDSTIGKFKLYLMDIYGNRELLYEGEQNVLYAQPVRPRQAPPQLPDVGDMPGSEKNAPEVRPGVFFSSNIFADAPAVVRERGRYLRVVESMPKNYSIGIVSSGGKPFGAEGLNSAWGAWGAEFLPGKSPTPTTDISWGDSTMFSGPATGLTGPLGVKQVHGTVPIRCDGSVRFEAPPCRMLYFQVLDEHQRAIHTMRSWVSVRPGEHRGCVGCHELHNTAQTLQAAAGCAAPDTLQPPPWGVRSLSYVQDIQPIFDRACADCHMGGGPAAAALDLTLRRDPQPRWGGIFPEPYVTLVLGKDHARCRDACPTFDATNYVAVPNTIATLYDTMPPLTCLSPKSRLIERAMDRSRCGQHLAAEDLQMLISWIDLWAMYRSDEELRAMEDPPADWFPLWACPPKTKSAPRVRTQYTQDEYRAPEDRTR